MSVKDLTENEYAPYQANYLFNVEDTWPLAEELEVSVHSLIRFVQDIPMDKFDYRYAEGKWTIKDILQHLIDTERIFAYRALRIARNDRTALPGFDETAYAGATEANARHLQNLLTELSIVRQGTIHLFKSFTAEDLLKTGTASGYLVSVRALGYLIIGHQYHHIKIYKERYL